MKKLVLIFGLFAVIVGSVAAYFAYNNPKIILSKPIEQGFKNPLFYRPLEAYGRTSWHTFLTPYSITLTPPFDEAKKTSKVIAESYLCNLIENEDDHIKYDCYVCAEFITYQPCHRECHNFIIKRYDEYGKGYIIKKDDCTGNLEHFIIKMS